MFKITFMVGNRHKESVDYLFPDDAIGKTLDDATCDLIDTLGGQLDDNQFIEIVSIDEITCSYSASMRNTLEKRIMEELK